MNRQPISLPSLPSVPSIDPKGKPAFKDQDQQLEIIKNILSKPQDQRNTHDLRTLVPLMLGIKFFKERKLKDREITEICSGLQYL